MIVLCLCGLCGLIVRVLARGTKCRGFDFRPFQFQVTNLGQVVHTHVPPSPSNIIWYLSRGGDDLRLGR